MKKLGFGFMRMPLTDPGDQAAIDMPRVEEMVDAFLGAGFTYCDTAWMYHDFMSEPTVGKAVVARYPRDSYTVASKMPVAMIHSHEEGVEIFGKQKEKLGVDFFDYYLVHDMNSVNYEFAKQYDMISFLQEKKEAGEIRTLGFSCHDSAEYLDRVLTECPFFEFVQLQINYLDWESEGIQSRKCYEVCVKHGKPVIVMEPVKGGTLASVPAEVETMMRAAHPDWSPASWALRFAASLPNVRTVLSGMSTLEQVRENTAFMAEMEPLNEAELELLRKAAAMIRELHDMGVRVMVSVWPTVDRRSENFAPMWERGLLMRTERGAAQTYDYQGDCVQLDLFRKETRDFLWEVCERNYKSLGVDGFWLDNAEPDLGVYDFDHYRYAKGSALRCTALYPQLFSRAFYEHMGPGSVNLIRSCWAGSQKYGNVVWSGDVPSTFEAFRDQLTAGLNMGLAGIPWWTTDIGGFMTDDVKDPAFRELLIRWFQFAVFSPVLRLHGDRGPHDIPPLDERDWGGGYLPTGQPNELWSFGEEVYAILRKWLKLRWELKPYLKELYAEASRTGAPLMRPMFWEFPEDAQCWETEDQYMFGSRYLVAPVLEAGAVSRRVYLPAGRWRLLSTGEIFDGGRTRTLPAPLEEMPVLEFLR